MKSYTSAIIPAKEVDEHEFFYSQETGGTIVSSALKLMDEVVKERYNPAQWNIYAASKHQTAITGPMTSALPAKFWREKILPVVRYYSYIEITHVARIRHCGENMSICNLLRQLCDAAYPRPDDIYPVFRELFHKQNATAKD